MNDLTVNTIQWQQTVYQTIEKLDSLSANEGLTLFVVNENGEMCGTVTDGDIRRGFLKGATLESPVHTVMSTDYIYLTENDYDIERLKSIKQKGVRLVPILDKEHRIRKVISFQRNRSFLPIDAVLMAGGKGERLRPLTESTPKPLLKVAGKCIIDYNIENLIRHGIDNIHVTVNYLAEQVQEHFSRPVEGVQIHCVREPHFLGTIGSVKLIGHLQKDTVLVMNSDLFTNIDLEGFYFHFLDNQADMSIAAIPYSVNVPYAIFELEGRNICSLKEKPTYHYYANAGIYLIRRELLDKIPAGTPFHATDLMELLIRENRKVIRFPHSGYWIDIGKPEDFSKVQDFAKHIK